MSSPAHLDVYSPDSKIALVCADVPELQQLLGQQLNSMNYQVQTGSSEDDALFKLRGHHYDLLVLTENFAGRRLGENPILQEVIAMPLISRHKLFVVLIGASLTTSNEWQAFQFSVDLVVGLADAANFKAALARGLSGWQDVYGRYLEAIQATDHA